MINRPNAFPIFFACVLALTAGSTVVAQTQTAPAPPPINTPAPVETPAVAPPPAPAPADGSSTEAPAERPTTYTVVAGDSFWLIAQKFDTSVKKLKKLNNIKGNLLHPGQVLKIPPAKGTPSTTPTSTDQPKSTSADKAKTIQQTAPDVASIPETQPQPTASMTADANALAPTASATGLVATTTPTKSLHHHKKKKSSSSQETEVAGAIRAQPVQDFDIPASTFASCPVPLAVDPNQDEASPVPAPATKPAASTVAKSVAKEKTPTPRAALVSPSELATASVQPTPAPTVAETPIPAPTPEPAPAPSGLAANESSKHSSDAFVTDSTSDNGDNGSLSTSSSDWATRFKLEAESLANRDIGYDEAWRPPGERHAWEMDCSNTSRYLYKVTTGIELPRTASDQYYYLHLQNKAWDVPEAADGYADRNYLRDNLKPGDLLFWENTYRPERQPPITHVMIFLGTNEKGQWIMAGSQSSHGGLHNRHGGPDIYVFDPDKPSGGYSTWLGLVHHKGRFCAFGRPLEADPSKLSVANN